MELDQKLTVGAFRSQIEAYCGAEIRVAADELAKFRNDLAGSAKPSHAMAWTDAAFLAAGVYDELRQFLRLVRDSDAVPLDAVVRGYVRKNVLQVVAYAGESTNSAARMSDRARLRARARLCLFLEDLIAASTPRPDAQ